MDKLTDAELSTALADLGSWTRDGDTIRREVQAPAFLTGIDYVREVAEVAEQADHHPDIDIRWRRLTFVLTTHDSGGLTQADVDLAHAIDAVLAQHDSAGG
jgi:4a-hydroxytetrahydrobiopterin dehydratase